MSIERGDRIVVVDSTQDATSSMRRVRRTTSDALVAICRGHFSDARGSVVTSVVDSDDLVRAARHHRIAPLTHVATRDVDPELAALLRPDRDQAIAVHLTATAALDDLAAVLGDLPWLTFKGPVLSEHAHPTPGLRTYHDLDVLVDPLDLREVTRRLESAGWVVADYEDMLRNPEVPGEMHWNSPSGLQLDLHWSMINMATRRRRFTIDSRSLIDRRRRMPVALTEVWTLDPVDTLVHVCLHAALSGAHRMLFLLDVDQVARSVTDWDAVATRAREWNATAHVAVVLDRAARVLGTPLPENVTTLLGVSPAFRRASALANRFSPVPDLRQDASVARLVSRAARPGTAQTLATVGRNSLVGIRNRLVGVGSETHSDRRTAGADAVDVYLRRVEAEARGEAR